MPSTPSLDGTLGVTLLGNLGAAILFGVTSVQASVYFRHYANDSAKLKYAVLLLCFLDALQLALITVSVYTGVVLSSGDPVLSLDNWSLKAHVAVAGVSNAIIRGLFCRRMWNFSHKNWVLVIFIAAGATVALAGSIEFSVQVFALLGDVFQLSPVSWLLYASLGAGVGSDVSIAISLCFFLCEACMGRDLRMKTMARKIVAYGVNTCMLTSLCEISCLVTYAVLPNNLTFLALFFILPKLLLNALLATLNSRDGLRTIRESSPASRARNTSSHMQAAEPSAGSSNRRSRFNISLMHSPGAADMPPLSTRLPRLPAVVRPMTFRASVKPSLVDVENGLFRFDPSSPLPSGGFHAL